MGYVIRINSGHNDVGMPDGRKYSGPMTASFSDVEYATIPSGLLSDGTLTVMSHTSDSNSLLENTLPVVTWYNQDFATLVPGTGSGLAIDWTADLQYHSQIGPVFATAAGSAITFTEDCTVSIWVNAGAYTINNDDTGNVTWIVAGTIMQLQPFVSLGTAWSQYLSPDAPYPFTPVTLPPVRVPSGTTLILYLQKNDITTDLAGDGVGIGLTRIG